MFNLAEKCLAPKTNDKKKSSRIKDF